MNILVIATQYPNEKNNGLNASTQFLHIYNKEFVKQGNSVTVIHVEREYPYLFNLLVLLAKKIQIFNSLGKYLKNLTIEKDYQLDGVNVKRIKIKKYLPHGDFPKQELSKAKKNIRQLISSNEVMPDAVIFDQLTPSIFFSELFTDMIKIVILHNTDFRYLAKKNISHYVEQLRVMDSILFRNKTHKSIFIKQIFKPHNSYMIYSGIPEYIILKEGFKPRKQIKKLLTVTRLVDGKYIEDILKALKNSNLSNYSYEIVGDGPLRKEIESVIFQLGLEKSCTLIGKMSREQVFKKMRAADCFVLLSKPETFGMVYVEAMSQGCITIGSKNQGIDGVIIDKINGYLIEPRDINSLTVLFNQLEKSSSEIISQISENAYNTTLEMTDSKLAISLLNYLIQLKEKKKYKSGE